MERPALKNNVFWEKKRKDKLYKEYNFMWNLLCRNLVLSGVKRSMTLGLEGAREYAQQHSARRGVRLATQR